MCKNIIEYEYKKCTKRVGLQEGNVNPDQPHRYFQSSVDALISNLEEGIKDKGSCLSNLQAENTHMRVDQMEIPMNK